MENDRHAGRRSARTLWGGVATIMAAALCSAAPEPDLIVDSRTDPALALDRLYALADSGYPIQAARQLREFIRLNPSWERIREANVLLGIALVRGGEVTDGRDTLARLIGEAPQSPDLATAYFYQGKAFEALGDAPAAVLSYRDLWTRFPQSDKAPDAALAEALLAETVLNNPARAREAYAAFVERYPDHSRAAGAMNRLAMLLDRMNAPAEARDLFRRYAERFPTHTGDPALGGAHIGAAAACFRAAQLSQQIGDNALAVELYSAYESFPQAIRGRGWIEAAHVARGINEGRDAAALYRRAVDANPREDYRLAQADWLKHIQDPGATAAHLEVARFATHAGVFIHCLANVDDAAFAAWLAAAPPSFPLFSAYLARFREGHERQLAGRAVLDAWLSRDDVHVKTQSARQWRETTGAVQDALREMRAAVHEGLLTETFEAALWISERLAPVAQALAEAPVAAIGEAGKPPEGEIQVVRMENALAVRARVFDARCKPDVEQWPDDVAFELYVSMPDTTVVRQVRFKAKGGGGLGETLLFENGNAVQAEIKDWGFVALNAGGYELLARVPFDLVNLDPNAERFLIEAAVQRQESFVTLFATGRGGAFQNNSQFGSLGSAGLSLAEGMKARDARADRFEPGPEWAAPIEAIAVWSGYPDVPADAVARRLVDLARAESRLRIETQAGGEAEPRSVPAERGMGARSLAIETLRTHGLANRAAGAQALAQLTVEAEMDTARDDLFAAATLIVRSDDPKPGEPTLTELLRRSAPGDARLLDVLQAAAARGAAAWNEPFWTEQISRRIEEELKALESPETSESQRWALLGLLRTGDAARSVAAHEDFLERYAASALAPAARRQLLIERARAGQNVVEDITALISALETRPELVLEIPVDLVPAGPEGVTAYALAFDKARIGERADLGPAALLDRMKLHARLGQEGAAIAAAIELDERYGASVQAAEGRELAAELLASGLWFTGVTQEQVQRVFQWLVAAATAGGNVGMDRLTGALWRMAGHPAERRPPFETYGRMHQYITQSVRDRDKSISELIGPVYSSFPGDGAAPMATMEFTAPPFRIGTQYSSAIWGVFYAPADGWYTFWADADNWMALEINGVALHDHNHHWGRGTRLPRGLHLVRGLFVSTYGNARLTVDWEGPGFSRRRFGGDAFSPDRRPLLMNAALAASGAWGVEAWDEYLRRFPRDARGQAMRLETLALVDPGRALAEAEARVKRFPGDPRAAQLVAECLWRIERRGESVDAYAAIAARFGDAEWESGPARLSARWFQGGMARDSAWRLYEDMLLASGDWTRWMNEAEARFGKEGVLRAHLAAAGQLAAARARAAYRERVTGALERTIEREQASRQAAQALAAQEGASDEVKAEAAQAVARAERTIAELERGATRGREALQMETAFVRSFEAALGLSAEQPHWAAMLKYALDSMNDGVFSDGALHEALDMVWGADREACRPIVVYLLNRSRIPYLARVAQERLHYLTSAKRFEDRHAARLFELGMSDPRNPEFADMLRRACDRALLEGDAFTFAKAAHVLARLHPEHATLPTYLRRLGEVFEAGGNWVSAEQEYSRVMQYGRTDEEKRLARLSLARLYERMGRPKDALRTLVALVPIAAPDETGAMKAPAPRPEPPVEGDAVEAAPPVEDTEALLAAVRSYLTLELYELALAAYDRAAVQKDFAAVKPDMELLVQLTETCLAVRMAATAEDAEDAEDGARHRALPPAIVERATKALTLTDALFRFYAETMQPRDRVRVTLLRADANMTIRNFPRAFEEIAEARRVAGDTPAVYLADLKLAELHLATDNAAEALPIFRRLSLLKLPEISPVALFWMGATELRQGNRDAAIEAYRQLWSQYADNELVRKAVYTIARTYAEQGAFLDAIRLYEAVGAINSVAREKVSPGDALTVKVLDPDHFVGTGMHTIPVQVRVTSGDVENSLLDMNKINNSLFLGTIPTTLGSAAPGDGILQVFGNDVIYVSYQDRFRGARQGETLTAETVRGETGTHTVLVADDALISVSPTVFVERDPSEEDVYAEKTEEQIAEERRLSDLSARLERGEAVVRPGSDVYIRVKDSNLSVSAERDTVSVEVFTYAPEAARAEAHRKQAVRNLFEHPRPPAAVNAMPSSGDFAIRRPIAEAPGRHPRLDRVRATLTETEPHSGVFHGVVKTDVNGPTAVASDSSGDRVAAYALDGRNEAKYAWVGFIDGRPDKWIEVDLKELHDIARIEWSRGLGAEDRFMIDYTVTLRGGDIPHDIEIKGNASPHENTIVVDPPVRARWVRFIAHTYDGDAPAIAHIGMLDSAGRVICPPETSPLDRAGNDILEFNVGDFMAAEFIDEFNIDPGRSLTRVSNPLGVAYTDGHIDAVYLAKGENPFRGSLMLGHDLEEEHHWYARRTRRVRPADVLQVALIDPDLDTDAERNSARFEAIGSSGDRVELVATEIESTAAIFRSRVQLSSDETAKERPDVLYVRTGDIVMLRYLDEQNREPGHAVYRESFVLVEEHELADFAATTVAVRSPQLAENRFEPPNWSIAVSAPSVAVPGSDRTRVRALSFATGDSVAFDVLLRDLSGELSSRLPVVIGPRPPAQRSRTADPNEPRRLRTLDDHHYRWSASGRTRDELDMPFAVAGDDIVWVSYTDETPKMASARQFLPILSASSLEQLGSLGAPIDNLPEAAVSEGVRIVLRDPHTEIRNRNRARDENIMWEIAWKKRHYRKQLSRFDARIAAVNARIEALNATLPAEAVEGQDAEAVEAQDVEATGDPVETSLEGGAEMQPLDDIDLDDPGALGAGLDVTANLVLAAALRRDSESMSVAMEALKLRLAALERYPTSEIEARIELEETTREAEAAEDEAPTTASGGEAHQPPPWFTTDDWWRNSGGLAPGTRLTVRVEDSDIGGDSVEALFLPMGGREPRFHSFTAQAVEGEAGVFEVSLLTTLGDEDGALPVDGARYLLMTYRDMGQTNFPPRRASFLSLASDARLNLTGPDFLEDKLEHHLGEDIYIVVADPDMDKTSERDYAFVSVEDESGDVEAFGLHESQPNSGVFRGSLPSRLGEAAPDDGTLQARFGGAFAVRYRDELWRSDSVRPPIMKAEGSFVSGSDGVVEIFARQLKRGNLQRDVLFNTALALYELGNSSMEMGAVQRGRQRLLDARERFLTVVRQYPDDPVCAHSLYYLGNIHFLLGDYEEAVRSLQDVINRWPRSEFKAMALFKLGVCHLRAGHMDRATESFVNLAYHHPDSPLVGDAMLALAQHFNSAEHIKAAISVGEAFLVKFPEHERADSMYLRVAGWLIAEEQFARAIEILVTAQEKRPRSPNMPAFLYWHAECLLRSTSPHTLEYRQAIVLLQRVVFDYPDTRWARYANGRLAQSGFRQ